MPADPQAPHARDHDPLRLVVAGGGVAALELLAALAATSPARLDILVLASAADFHDRPLHVVEPFGLGRLRRFPLDALCAGLGARFRRVEVEAVDAEAHLVHTADGVVIPYDVLVVATGAAAVPAFEQAATFDRERTPEEFDETLSAAVEGFAERVAVVVPDGVTWSLPAYELALLTADRLPAAQVTVVTHEPRAVAAFGPRVSAGIAEVLRAAGVTLLAGVHPDVVGATEMRVAGRWLQADRIVALPHLVGRSLPGLPHDAHGFLPVDGHGRVMGADDVYAAGDGTTLPIKQGGLAAQQADAVAGDLVARLAGRPAPEPARLVLRATLRGGAAPLYLRTELHDPAGTSTLSTEPLWWPPTKVASRWLAAHLARLELEQPSAPVPELA